MFIVDDTDVIKPYGKAFKAMGNVRDASHPGKANKHEHGYKVTTITGLSEGRKQPLPLFDQVHSPFELDYLSANNVTNAGVRRICEHLRAKEGMFVGDRGYDDVKFMKMVSDAGQHFLVRMCNNRWLNFEKGRVKAFDKAKSFKGKVVVPMTVYAKERLIKASACRCKLNGYGEAVWVVASHMDGDPDPLILITNKPLEKKEDITQMVYRYSSRWRIEEYFRFKKTELGFENFRVKSLDSINDLTFALDIAIMLLAVIVEEGLPYLYSKLKGYEKAIKENVSIEFYRVLSSVSAVFGMNKKGVKNYKKVERRAPMQMRLFKI